MPYATKHIGKILNGYEVLDSYKRKTAKSGNTIYLVRCIHCGKTQEKYSSSVINGTAKCVCVSRRKRLGEHQNRLQNVWKKMLLRCYDPKNKSFPRYGARGITVCEEWHDFSTFYKWAIVGYAEGLTLDRINNDGNYEPSNCRWATIKEQNNNTSNCHFVEYNGQIMSISKLSDICGVSYSALYQRIRSGWSVEDAVTVPVRLGNNQTTKRRKP